MAFLWVNVSCLPGLECVLLKQPQIDVDVYMDDLVISAVGDANTITEVLAEGVGALDELISQDTGHGWGAQVAIQKLALVTSSQGLFH